MPALRTRDTQSSQTLEVSTTSLPQLTLIAPTPRAFTFPHTHNLSSSTSSSPAASPYSSRSNSPLSAYPSASLSAPYSSFGFSSQNDSASGYGSEYLAYPTFPTYNKQESTTTQFPRTPSPTHTPTPTSASTGLPLLPSLSPSSTLSPTSTLPPSTPSPTSPSTTPTKRRKSSASSDVILGSGVLASPGGEPQQRRPKKGDEDYVKRPENAFILFRRKCCEDRQAAQDEASPSTTNGTTSSPDTTSRGSTAGQAAAIPPPPKKQRQADLSKTISQQWKSLSNEERKYWEELAKNKKAEHEKRYPHYVYRPQRVGRDGRKRKGSSASAIAGAVAQEEGLGQEGRLGAPIKKLSLDSSNTVSFIVPIPRGGRSSTPPPYQSIQIPNVYLPPLPSSNAPNSDLSGGCAMGSPTLLPMITRRMPYHGHGHAQAQNGNAFDYVAGPVVGGEGYGYGQGQAQAQAQPWTGIQSSEFLRSMFANTPSSTSPSSLLPAHEILPSTRSGADSGSSSPSSPTSAPYTPTSSSASTLEAHARAEMEMQLHLSEMDMSMGLGMGGVHREFAAFSWDAPASAPHHLDEEYNQSMGMMSSAGRAGSIWGPTDEFRLGADDFDIDAIRPVAFGEFGKFASNSESPSSASERAEGDANEGANATGLEFGAEFNHALDMDMDMDMGLGFGGSFNSFGLGGGMNGMGDNNMGGGRNFGMLEFDEMITQHQHHF